MGAECFWSSFRPGELEFCEAKLCSIIVSPAETWSNLAYIMIGILILTRFSRLPGSKRFAFYALLVGTFSFAYHMSHIWIFETLDLGSMLFLGTELVCANLVRLGWLDPKRFWRVYTVLVVGSFGLLFLLKGDDRLGPFGGVIALATFFEVLLYIRLKRQNELPRYLAYLTTLALFAISYSFWILDHSRIWCDPEAHFWSGHAIWHIVNSGCFLTLLCHFSQFSVTSNALRPSPSVG